MLVLMNKNILYNYDSYEKIAIIIESQLANAHIILNNIHLRDAILQDMENAVLIIHSSINNIILWKKPRQLISRLFKLFQ